MNKFLFLFLILLINSCSFNSNSGFWTEQKKIKKDNKIFKQAFKKDKVLKKEFNSNLVIKLDSKLKNSNFLNNTSNNTGRINFNGELKKISKFNFSKIDNFNYFEPELVFNSPLKLILPVL